MSVPTADFASVVPWAGVQNKPDYFPTTPSLISQGTATDGQYLQWSQARSRWEPVTIPPGAVLWGDIGGTLSNQTDLQAALDLKADISSLAAVAFSGAYADLTGAPSSLPPSGAAGGDLAGAYPNPTLKVIGAATGPIGDATHVPVVTIDAKGRVTALTSAIISGSGLPWINVEDYGADPSNSAATNTTAINLAIAAMVSGCTLYLPRLYPITIGSISTISGMDNITIMGNGRYSSGLTSSATGAPSNFIEINTCNYVTVIGIGFIGSATVRGSGVGLRFYASYGAILSCYFKGMSDFAIHIAGDGAGSTYSDQVQAIGNHIKAPLGDGIHCGSVRDVQLSDNLCEDTGDDSLAFVGDTVNLGPIRGTIVGNHIYDSARRGIAILEATDFLVNDNNITNTQLSAIEVNRYTSTTFYNLRGEVSDNRCYNSTITGGPIGALAMYYCTEVTFDGNSVYSPATGSGMVFGDVVNCYITKNKFRNCPAYGIRGFDFGEVSVAAGAFVAGLTYLITFVGTTNFTAIGASANTVGVVFVATGAGSGSGTANTTNFRVAQGPLSIKGNIVDGCADYAVWAVADIGCIITGLMCNENEGIAISGANTVVYYNRITTGRVINNYSFGAAITAGGTVSGVTNSPNY